MSAPQKSRFTLKLDDLEREGAPDPFDVELGGVTYEFADAMNIDWQELMSSMTGDVKRFFRLVLGEKAETFLAAKLPTWKMRHLMEAYQKHYGLTDPGEAPGSATS